MFKKNLKKKDKEKEIADVLLLPKPDRRLLANVPDAEGERSNTDRRGSHIDPAAKQSVDILVSDMQEIRQARSMEYGIAEQGESLAAGQPTPKN